MRPGTEDNEKTKTITLEAFADTIIPGRKRFPGDTAIAGASAEPGAVEAGALELLATHAAGLAAGLHDGARALNTHARTYARDHGISLDRTLPEFVALPFAARTSLVRALTSPGHPEKEIWVALALFSNMAFDTAAHMHTLDALAEGHPGLTHMGVARPDADGLWRFPEFSYGRPLADLHPNTISSGSLS